VLVILNRQTTAVNDAIVGIPQNIQTAEIYNTSRTKSRVRTEAVPSGQKVTLSMEPKSIYTLVLSY
jgi:hypothetical protein